MRLTSQLAFTKPSVRLLTLSLALSPFMLTGCKLSEMKRSVVELTREEDLLLVKLDQLERDEQLNVQAIFSTKHDEQRRHSLSQELLSLERQLSRLNRSISEQKTQLETHESYLRQYGTQTP